MPLTVDHHRFVDLHLVCRADLVVVRLVAGRVLVVGVARDGARRRHGARLEQHLARRIAHSHVQPGAARRVSRRQLVAGQVLDDDGEGGARPGAARHRRFAPSAVSARSCRSVAIAAASSSCDGAVTPRSCAIAVQHPQHEEVAAEEGVAAQTLARLAEDRGNRRRLGDRRHVAILAAPFRAVRAVLPLEKRHLLGKPADRAALGVERLVNSVWHVAHSSDWRTWSDSVGVNPVADRITCVRPSSTCERPEHRLRAGGVGDVEDVAAGEALGRCRAARR